MLAIPHIYFTCPHDFKLLEGRENFSFLRSFFQILIGGPVHAGKCGNKYQVNKELIKAVGCNQCVLVIRKT